MRIGSESKLSTPSPINNPSIQDALSSPKDFSSQLASLSDQTTPKDQDDVKKAFQDFVGQTFFGQMIASMRSTQEDAPYFNGGRAEKIFQGQLDQVLSEELSNSSAAQFSDPMYKLFQMNRQ